jgi:hypothetical protein
LIIRLEGKVLINIDQSTREKFTERIAKLSPAKRALLEKKLQGEFASTVPLPAILQRSGDGPVSLSFAQQRLWFLDQLEPSNPIYNAPPLAIRLKGKLDVSALEQSFNEVVNRHEILRTNFIVVNSEPVQVVMPQLTLTLPVVDLQHFPAPEREVHAAELIRQEASGSFNLAEGPFIRATLLRLWPEEHILVLIMHHIVIDGWSTGILMRELAALYQAFATGQLSSLAPLPIQYADFAQWQRQWLQGEVLETQLAYWKRQLANASSPMLPLC